MLILGKELNKNVISTEGCFACDLNKSPKGQQQPQPVPLTRPSSRRNSSPPNGRRRRHHHGSRQRRHLEKPALIGMSQVFKVANPLFETSNVTLASPVVADKQIATKLTVKLTRERTKLKRPILFLQPALTEDLMTSRHVYSLKGKDKSLFGLRRDPNGVWALFYQVIE